MVMIDEREGGAEKEDGKTDEHERKSVEGGRCGARKKRFPPPVR
jgi:hypothetical protein